MKIILRGGKFIRLDFLDYLEFVSYKFRFKRKFWVSWFLVLLVFFVFDGVFGRRGDVGEKFRELFLGFGL